MNLDKTIEELSNRLDVVYPYSSFSSNNEIKNNGINYWKGKKIISAKKWNEIYEKNSIYTDNYRITLVSNKPLQYFPDDYNGSISSFNEELKEETQKWNKEYYELLEFRKNPTLGRNQCSRCIFSADSADPLFVGIGKVLARIVSNHCKNNNLNSINNVDNDIISYPCKVMNFFQCPFESNNNQYPYTNEKLFALQRLAFAIEQAISIFHEITKNNEIIYEVDFDNDRVQEIHTNYNGEPYNWRWDNLNVKEQLSKVKPISPIIQIINEQEIYNILTNREKLEYLLQEYEKNDQLDKDGGEQQVCCHQNIPCVNSNKEKLSYNILPVRGNQLQAKGEDKDNVDYSHKDENSDSQIKEHLGKSNKENSRQNIIDFIINNKDSIRIEDLKISEPFYKCYREKGNCIICNSLSNIICTNCCNNHNVNNEVWLCTYTLAKT